MSNPGGLVLTPDELRVLNTVLDKITKHPEFVQLNQVDNALVASMAETVRKQWSQIEDVQRMFGAKPVE
jgi:hypothetical protein